MGTDIHLAVEHKVQGKWKRVLPPDSFPRDPWILAEIAKYEVSGDAPETLERFRRKADEEWYSWRNYYAFAILAGIRYDHFKPISQPKGLPVDLCEELQQNEYSIFWLGDHSFSWLTVAELLDYDWNQVVSNSGVISWAVFVSRIEENISSEPKIYAQGVWGSNVEVISDTEAYEIHAALKKCSRLKLDGKDYHVRISWLQTCADAAKSFYDIIPHLAKIDPNPENIRIVFGFDS